MSNFNIDLQPEYLQTVIQNLESDNNKICEIINSINSDLNQLNETVWVSEEKNQIDSQIFPYMKNVTSNVGVELNASTLMLKQALKSYLVANKSLEQQTENLIS